METSTQTNGNGNGHTTTAPAEPSALTKLLADCKGQKVNETDKKKTGEAFKKFAGKRAELQKALDDHDAQADALAVNMIRCFGAKTVTVDGVRYTPTSRGTRIYYKKMSSVKDDLEL